MTDNRTGVPLITDILDVLARHGYARGDTAHTARAILLISDLASIYGGSQDHPFGPYTGEPPSGTEPAPSGPADRDVVVPLASELNTVVAALDDARLYKRDRVATCADCIDMSCGNCQGRLQAAHTYATRHLVGRPAASADLRPEPRLLR